MISERVTLKRLTIIPKMLLVVLLLAVMVEPHNIQPGIAVAFYGNTESGFRDRINLDMTSLTPFSPTGNLETSFLPQGRIRESNKGVLFMNGGDTIYRSDDGGHQWQALPDPAYWGSKSVMALSSTFDEDQTLFVGLNYGNNAFLISTDGGQSWHSPQDQILGPILDIGVSPDFSIDHTIYVSTNDYKNIGLLRSTDSGEHWQAVTRPGQSLISAFTISPNYGSDQTLFVRLENNNIFRSDNGGLTWGRADVGLGTDSGNIVSDLAIAATDSDLVLFAATMSGIVYSFDEGQIWYLLDIAYFSSIAVSFYTDDYHLDIFGIVAENGKLRRSSDFSDKWTDLLSGVSVDNFVISPNYIYDNSLYTKNAKTMWESKDRGGNWTVTSAKPDVSTDSYSRFNLIVSPNYDIDRTVYSYPKDSNGWFLKSTDGGYSWTIKPLPQSGTPLSMVISPGFSSDHTLITVIHNTLYESINSGDTWTKMYDAPTYDVNILRISPGYTTDHTLFIARYASGIYRTNNDGQTWTEITGIQPYITDIDISPGYPADPTIFVVVYNDGIFRSENNGSSWVNLSGPRNYIPDYIVELSPSYLQDGTLFVGVSGQSDGGAFRSTNKGTSWENITCAGLSTYITAIAISPHFSQDQTIIMASTGFLPLISEDAGNTWFPLNGIPSINNMGVPYGASITYENGLLQPFASTPQGIFRYKWPNLIAPDGIRIGIKQGITDTVETSLPLAYNGQAGANWEVSSSADWLEVAPISGTLPTQVILSVDPAKLEGSPYQTTINVRSNWSYRQSTSTTIPVEVYFYTDRLWFPVIWR